METHYKCMARARFREGGLHHPIQKIGPKVEFSGTSPLVRVLRTLPAIGSSTFGHSLSLKRIQLRACDPEHQASSRCFAGANEPFHD